MDGTRIPAAEEMSQERWENHRNEHLIHERNHEREHQSSDTAIKLGLESLNERLSVMNEFRQQLQDERSSYVRRDMLDTRVESQDKADKLLEERINKLETLSASASAQIKVVGVVISAIVILVNIAVPLLLG